jgi:hypothetical protein
MNLLSPSSGFKMHEDVPMNVGDLIGVFCDIITQQTKILIFINVHLQLNVSPDRDQNI